MNKLPANTVQLIKSGQVITSVWSVIKELVENSIDANATNIEVRLLNYGLDLIEVKDNGTGVDPKDIPLMVQGHCTSKIKSFEDLESVTSYGFRGEALHSLCSVSTMEISSKREQDKAAKSVKFDTTCQKVKETFVASTNGTIIKAFNLFENMPVRRNYFKKTNRQKEDLKKTEIVLWSFAFVHPGLRISFHHNNQSILIKTACDSLLKASQEVFGLEVATGLQRFQLEFENFTIDCLLPKMDSMESCSKTTNESLFVYVNKRPVTLKPFEKILKAIFNDKFPMGFVSIETDQEELDVNIEPNKTEVMIAKQKILIEFIEAKIKEMYFKETETVDNNSEDLVSAQPHNFKKRTIIEENANFNIKNKRPHLEESNSFHVQNESSINLVGSKGDLTTFERHQEEKEKFVKDFRKVNSNPSLGDVSFVNTTPDKNCEVIAQNSKGEQLIRNEKGSWSKGTLFQNSTTGLFPGPSSLGQKRNKENLSKCDSFEDYFPIPEKRPKQVLITSFNDSLNESLDDSYNTSRKKFEFVEMEPTVSKPRKLDKKMRKFDEESFDSVDSFVEMMRAKQNKLDDSILKEKIVPNSEKEEIVANPVKKKKNSQKKEVVMKFDFEKVRESVIATQESFTTNTNVMSYIGQIENAWFFKRCDDLLVFNPLRLQEVDIFKNLMQNHILPSSKISKIIDVYESYAWNSDLNEVIEKLMVENEINDARIVHNGFKVVNSKGTPIVTEMSSDVDLIGLSDLQEILKAMKANPEVTVEQSRPLKVRSYLKAKAAQMAKQLPPNPDVDVMMNNILALNISVDDVCIHSQPLCQKVMSLQSLKESD